MRIVGLSSILILVTAAAGGATLLSKTAAAQKSERVGQVAQTPFIVYQSNVVRIPLRDERGEVRGTLAYIPGASGKGAVTVTDSNGARIELLAASELPPLPALDVSRIRLPAPPGGLDEGKSDGGSNEKYLKEELRKLDNRVKQLEARLRK